MYKIMIKFRILVIFAFIASTVSCAGIPGIVAKYGEPGCTQWSKRIAYRQVCTRYSGGVCMNYKTESYWQDYCVHWKTKKQVEYERCVQSNTLGPYVDCEKILKGKTKGKTSEPTADKELESKFAMAAGASSGNKSDGDTFLRTQLAPFICKILQADDVAKTLDTLGKYKQKEKGDYNRFEYSTKKFYGKYSYQIRPKKKGYLRINSRKWKKKWPFTDSDFDNWLSSIGLVVYKKGNLESHGFYRQDDDNRLSIFRKKNHASRETKDQISVLWGEKDVPRKILCND